MRVDAPTIDDIRHVAERMRSRDVEEFLALSPAEDAGQLAAALVDRWAGRPDTFVVGADEPIAIGAMLASRPGVVTLMFFATDAFPTIALPLTRFIVRRLFPAYRARGVHRIECVSIAGYTEAHRWIELLGLAREAEFPGYGKAGETFVQFAWVSDVRPTGA